MPVVSELGRADASPGVAAMYDRIFGEGRDPVAEPGTATGTPGNWWTIWARTPNLLSFFSQYSYNDAPLAPELRGLVLARTGYVRESRFVYSQHCKSARMLGVPEEKIAGLPAWQVKDVYTPRERAVLAFVDGIAGDDGRVHDDVFAAVQAHFDAEQILVLVYFINLYILHSTTCRALRLEYDDIAERIVEIPKPKA
ncbi:MAG: carboxymuconolactone decarboxylase family protein [Phenylobacterium sp.]|nr:carboxymuconolactone decarboxylase family protein [Phenylobacterium sp.]